jgi:hypothetical protein
MKNMTAHLHRLVLCATLTAGCALAQGNPPVGPFQAVHMLRVDPQNAGAEKTMLAAIAEMNEEIAKAGCAECIYHLWKVSGKQNGSYNYIQISHWPGGAVYLKVHNDPGYAAASAKFSALRSVVQEEVYNRFEEVGPATK